MKSATFDFAPLFKPGLPTPAAKCAALSKIQLHRWQCPRWVMTNKTQGEHNRSAFGCMTIKAPLGRTC
jgi:hypothetical protein